MHALTNVIMESYLQCVATDVHSVVEQLGVENISPSTVSRMAKELDAAVHQLFPNASWQLCQAHFMRNPRTMAKKHWPEVSYKMKAALNNPEAVHAVREKLISLY